MENTKLGEVNRRRTLNIISNMSKDYYEFEISFKTDEEKAKMIDIIDKKKASISYDNRKTNYQRYETLAMADSDLVDIATIKSFELACIFRSIKDFQEASRYALGSENPDAQIARDFQTNEEHVRCYRLYNEVEKAVKQNRLQQK